MTNGCAWNAVLAFANCGRAVAHVQGSYVPLGDIADRSSITSFTAKASAGSN